MPTSTQHHPQRLPAYLPIPSSHLTPQHLQPALESFNARANDLSTTFANLQSTYFLLQSDFPLERSAVSFKDQDDMIGVFFPQGKSVGELNQRSRRARSRVVSKFRTVKSAQEKAREAMEASDFGAAGANLLMGERTMETLVGMLKGLGRSVEKYAEGENAAAAAAAAADQVVGEVLSEAPSEVEAEGEEEDDDDDGVIIIVDKSDPRRKTQSELESFLKDDQVILHAVWRCETKGESNRRWSWVV